MDLLGYQFDAVALGMAIGIIIGAVIVAEVLLRLFNAVFKRISSQTKTTLDDRILEASHGPFRLLFALFGVYFAVQYAYGPQVIFSRSLNDWLLIAFIGAAGHAAASLINASLVWYASEFKGSKLSKEIFPITRKLVKVSIYVVTLLVMLSQLGVEIMPLLAGLGVIGLAVGLALQSTLANFFGGIHILLDKTFKVGDYVAINSESGTRGFVKKIGWRTTKLKSFANTEYIVPNDIIANATVINYSSARDKGRSVVFEVGVDYESDPNKIEKLLKQAVKNAARKNPAIVKDYKTVARFENFGDSSLSFKLVFQVDKYTSRYGAQAQVKRELLLLFRKNKVNVPYPIRTVYLKK
jgi:small-conductance mechanosensitive channel